jgi:hypothetical protein
MIEAAPQASQLPAERAVHRAALTCLHTHESVAVPVRTAPEPILSKSSHGVLEVVEVIHGCPASIGKDEVGLDTFVTPLAAHHGLTFLESFNDFGAKVWNTVIVMAGLDGDRAGTLTGSAESAWNDSWFDPACHWGIVDTALDDDILLLLVKVAKRAEVLAGEGHAQDLVLQHLILVEALANPVGTGGGGQSAHESGQSL